MNSSHFKTALKHSSAPIVEVEVLFSHFDNANTEKNLDEFIKDHYAKVQTQNYWAKMKEKY